MLFLQNLCLDAAIVLASLRRSVGIAGLVGAVTFGDNLLLPYPNANQIIADGVGTLLRERDIVIAVAIAVGVSRYFNDKIGILREHFGKLIELVIRFGTEVAAVGIEENIVEHNLAAWVFGKAFHQ